MPNAVAANVVKAHVETIERLEREAHQVDEAIAEAFAAAKRDGLDLKTLRAVLKKRRQDPAARSEAEALEALYLDAAS